MIASVALRGCPVEPGFDPLSPEFLADPFAVMTGLRLAERPVFYAPAIDYYVISGYRDIEAIFSDHESYSAAAAQLPLVELDPQARQILLDGGHRPQPSMVSLDPPAHTRLRRPTARAFSARRTAEMEPRIRVVVDELLDAIDPAAPFDLVSALTFPLPATVVFSFMGVPEEDYAQLKRWCGYRAKLAWGRPAAEEQIEHARNMTAYRRYLRELVAAKDTERGDDFTSALLAIHDEDPDQLSHEEIASILFSLSFAGHETTNYLIGNILRRLLEDPGRWDAVVADPALIPNAIEETLRYDPSVPVWRRLTRRDVTIAGADIPEGSKLFLWLAAAGRDSSVFPDPDMFDLHRENAKRHLAFGKGIHFCIGSALGKLEARLALEALTNRFPALRLVADQTLTFHPNISFRGPQTLWAHVR
ncbi:MAG TPA: cytochrome P450 [Solirubrobacteraceae bacterium]|nr:cytochrome P450 [Solirubrobacteraceae bacterium]